MLVDLEVFYLGHLKNLYTIQYNTILRCSRSFKVIDIGINLKPVCDFL